MLSFILMTSFFSLLAQPKAGEITLRSGQKIHGKIKGHVWRSIPYRFFIRELGRGGVRFSPFRRRIRVDSVQAVMTANGTYLKRLDAEVLQSMNGGKQLTPRRQYYDREWDPMMRRLVSGETELYVYEGLRGPVYVVYREGTFLPLLKKSRGGMGFREQLTGNFSYEDAPSADRLQYLEPAMTDYIVQYNESVGGQPGKVSPKRPHGISFSVRSGLLVTALEENRLVDNPETGETDRVSIGYPSAVSIRFDADLEIYLSPWQRHVALGFNLNTYRVRAETEVATIGSTGRSYQAYNLQFGLRVNSDPIGKAILFARGDVLLGGHRERLTDGRFTGKTDIVAGTEFNAGVHYGKWTASLLFQPRRSITPSFEDEYTLYASGFGALIGWRF